MGGIDHGGCGICSNFPKSIGEPASLNDGSPICIEESSKTEVSEEFKDEHPYLGLYDEKKDQKEEEEEKEVAQYPGACPGDGC